MAAGFEIKRLREKQEKKLSAETVAKLIGVESERLRKWEQRDVNPKDSGDIEKVEKYFGISLDKLKNLDNFLFYVPETDNVKTFQQKLLDQKLKKGQKQIPFYDAQAQAGELEYAEMTAVSAPSGTIDVGDLLNDSEAAIRVYGNSMQPNYPPGCVVGLFKCEKTFIEPGEVYVIETRFKRMIKRLFYKDDDPESNIIMAYSDNTMKFEGGSRHGKPAYPSFNIPADEIINLFAVTGVIKRNMNSVVINR